MTDELWRKCELLSKNNQIKIVSHILADEIKSRLKKPVGPSIDIEYIIVTVYDPKATYSVKGFVTALVDILNNSELKTEGAK